MEILYQLNRGGRGEKGRESKGRERGMAEEGASVGDLCRLIVMKCQEITTE